MCPRICPSYQDVGKWQTGGIMFRWCKKAVSYQRKVKKKGMLTHSDIWATSNMLYIKQLMLQYLMYISCYWFQDLDLVE